MPASEAVVEDHQTSACPQGECDDLRLSPIEVREQVRSVRIVESTDPDPWCCGQVLTTSGPAPAPDQLVPYGGRYENLIVEAPEELEVPETREGDDRCESTTTGRSAEGIRNVPIELVRIVAEGRDLEPVQGVEELLPRQSSQLGSPTG